MKRILAPLAVLFTLALAACGSSPSAHQPVVHTTQPGAAVSHCTPSDEAMQCVLQGQSNPSRQGVGPVGANESLGVDFTLWGGCPSPSGHAFGASYLSYDPSKDWTPSCVAEWHNAGAATLAVFEASGNPSGSNGATDARSAAAQLRNLGAPANYPILLAVDCDCSGAPLIDYFRSANQAEPGRINAYGGYSQIQTLYNAHLVGHDNWQTYAWSNGLWLPASIAPVEQYLNSSSEDFDRSFVIAHGGWLLASAPPAPRLYCWGKGSTPDKGPCPDVRAKAKHYWQQYLAFHHGLALHEHQLAAVKKFVGYLEQNKKSIHVPPYSGPGIGYLTGRDAEEAHWQKWNYTNYHALLVRYTRHKS